MCNSHILQCSTGSNCNGNSKLLSRMDIYQQNFCFNKDLCYVSCTPVPLSILSSHLLHNHNLSFTAHPKTAVKIKNCSIYKNLHSPYNVCDKENNNVMRRDLLMGYRSTEVNKLNQQLFAYTR